jgi:hypothetical protein
MTVTQQMQIRELMEQKGLAIDETNLHAWVDFLIGRTIGSITNKQIIKEVEQCLDAYYVPAKKKINKKPKK